jgi:F-type H+-transporting ATPase subunit b
MDKLVSFDPGLIIWTVVTFLLLVAILTKTAWRPILNALEERDRKIREDLETAKRAREEAERKRLEMEGRLADLRTQGAEMLAKAAQEGEKLRHGLKTQAEAEIHKMKERASADLEAEKERLVGELRREAAGLSVRAAEKLLGRSVDGGVQKEIMGSFLKDLEGQGKAEHAGKR